MYYLYGIRLVWKAVMLTFCSDYFVGCAYVMVPRLMKKFCDLNHSGIL